MTVKEQLKKVKDNWLIVAGIIVLGIIVFSMSSISNLGSSFSGVTAQRSIMPSIAPSYDYGGAGYNAISEEAAVYGIAASTDKAAIAGRKITKTSSLETEAETGKFREAESEMKTAITSVDALILNEDVQLHKSGSIEYYTGQYRIKVESSKYEELVGELKGIAKLERFSENSDDITESYTDLEVELNAEKERLARYKVILEETKESEFKIQLIDRIFTQEKTIEYLEKAIKEADKRVDYVNINVWMTEEQPGYFNLQFVKFYELVENVINGASTLLKIISYLLPYGIVVFAIWGIRRHFKRKR
ncbi:MAG: DUF4349 domain-containing protein [Candidatus Nanoarchaeia archaeon]|nr:DUF4349 domain-containing protein [Candidatus Nanoarchaeia archaeon]